MEVEGYSLPHFPSSPGGTELLEFLRACHQHYSADPCRRPGSLNSDLLRIDPCDLPGMVQGRKKEKYFVTDCVDLRICFDPPATPGGSWESRSLGWGIRVPDNSNDLTRFVGIKRTYYWVDTETSLHGCAKTRWVMNVYFLLDHNDKVKSDLVLCHIFEHDSADYDPRPQCASHEAPAGKGEPLHQAIHGQSNHCLHGEAPCVLLTHTTPEANQPLSPVTSTYLKQLEKLYCPETSTEPENYNPNGEGPSSTTVITKCKNRRSGKRTKICSDVWLRFTKLFAADGPDGDGETAVLAVCNHCGKVLKADSRNGTSHLIRHKCPCSH